MDISKVPTCELCAELEKRLGVQTIIVNECSTIEIFGDGDKKITEPVRTGPATIYVVID